MNPDFPARHIGPNATDTAAMLDALSLKSLDDLLKEVVPDSILNTEALPLADALSEHDALAALQTIASKNKVVRSLLGQGYFDCFTPSVIRRCVLENPGWYTAYTPYQPEIAQGRLEVLFNFQTLIAELTGLPIANASLLDEATAAAEAVAMAHRIARGKKQLVIVDSGCHPQTLAVLNTRTEPLGIHVELADVADLPGLIAERSKDVFAVVTQYTHTQGDVQDIESVIKATQVSKALSIVIADPLSLMLLPAPGPLGADVVVGSAQRFGVPMGFGGPHAAFMACSDACKRNMPGRLVGQSITASGQTAYRLALQTREQHIRRDKATSNICTAQALLAIVATLYACYHGPEGLQTIASHTRDRADQLAASLAALQLDVLTTDWFDTFSVRISENRIDPVIEALLSANFNVRRYSDNILSFSVDETTSSNDVRSIVVACAIGLGLTDEGAVEVALNATPRQRQTLHDRPLNFLTQRCFNAYHSETEMMRYCRQLADKDLALDRAMIPLGSCTMKLNAASEMMPILWPEFSRMHPFAPSTQTEGYQQLIAEVEQALCACTGYDAVSLQPNAGSQGEYAGLLAIRAYHQSRGEANRTVCLIPASAHGTNPASAQMVGMQVVVVKCDAAGNVDLIDLDDKLAKHAGAVAAIMITYPSTHGVFEANVRTVCQRVHEAGGQVYIDGANMNAMVGVAQPGEFGGDVSHLNLHKTFCIPHGGGGPGIGPVAVGAHLAGFLPGHDLLPRQQGAVSAAPFGSAMILPITWMYIRMMGSQGLAQATKLAILNANYMAERLSTVFPILYRGENGRVAHECIVDTRVLKDSAGITVDDIAKRLIDHGFHAPTMSFPVPGTLMVEPTESESLAEIDRFCDAMLSIYEEAVRVGQGEWPADNNPLFNAPHTANVLVSDEWDAPYSRQIAAFPCGTTQLAVKYWPPVDRVDHVYGDKNLICSCPPLTDYLNDAEAANSDTGSSEQLKSFKVS